MAHTTRLRLRTFWERFPEAILISVMTAVGVMILAVLLSTVTGSEARRAVNEVFDHAAVTRCEMAYVIDILKEIGAQSPNIDLSDVPNINTEGLECDAYVQAPFDPSRNIWGAP